jgi:uncharacterized membrane protein
MKENLENIVSNLQGLADIASSYAEPIHNKDKRKKHSNSELIISSTVTSVVVNLKAVEYHLMQIESQMNGLEEFIEELKVATEEGSK